MGLGAEQRVGITRPRAGAGRALQWRMPDTYPFRTSVSTGKLCKIFDEKQAIGSALN